MKVFRRSAIAVAIVWCLSACGDDRSMLSAPEPSASLMVDASTSSSAPLPSPGPMLVPSASVLGTAVTSALQPTTTLPPWPAATTTTIVVDTMAPSTTAQPQPSPVESAWSPSVVLNDGDHPDHVALSVGDLVALVISDPQRYGVGLDPNRPQDSFGVDADVLRVVAFGGSCPVGALCAAWVAVDAGVSSIAVPSRASDSCTQFEPGQNQPCPDPAVEVTVGLGDRPVRRIGMDSDGGSIAVPVGTIIDVHLDEVSSRMYNAGDAMRLEYWGTPTATDSTVVQPIGQAAPVFCHDDALGVHDCLSLLAVAPGMTTLVFESGYTCDFGGCGDPPKLERKTFTVTIAVT